jgi:thiol-disulfide isomerase/thioredoxin
MSVTNIWALLVAVAAIVCAIIYLDNDKAAPVAKSVTPIIERALPEALEPTQKEAGSEKTATLTLEREKTTPIAPSSKALLYERAKEITTPDGFLNSPNSGGADKPFAIGEFVGKKVVLLDIWTYSCINCQRTLPYLNSWHEKYADKGLVIIGLHTPEFEFEKVYENVLSAVEKFGIKYPVVLDNDYSTWQAYRNRYWPRKYLIDIDGYIVYDRIGEGGYEETERQIQKALNERAKRLGEGNVTALPLTEETTPARAGSPETYFGSKRNELLANGKQGVSGEQTFSLPDTLMQNQLYFGGTWNIQDEYAENEIAGASIAFRYRSKEVYFVASSERGVRVKLYLDGKLLKGEGTTVLECREQGWCGGDDVSIDGTAFIKEDRLYKLIEHTGEETHTLRIEAESPGLKAFTFTFG